MSRRRDRESLPKAHRKVDKKNFVGLPIPVAGGFIAALVHFSPLPLIYFGPERARIYSGLLMVLVGLLSLMMVSTLRFSSFKTVGTSKSQHAARSFSRSQWEC